MTFQDYITNLKAEVQKFEEGYAAQARKFPELYPLNLPEPKWDDQFVLWNHDAVREE